MNIIKVKVFFSIFLNKKNWLILSFAFLTFSTLTSACGIQSDPWYLFPNKNFGYDPDIQQHSDSSRLFKSFIPVSYNKPYQQKNSNIYWFINEAMKNNQRRIFISANDGVQFTTKEGFCLERSQRRLHDKLYRIINESYSSYKKLTSKMEHKKSAKVDFWNLEPKKNVLKKEYAKKKKASRYITMIGSKFIPYCGDDIGSIPSWLNVRKKLQKLQSKFEFKRSASVALIAGHIRSKELEEAKLLIEQYKLDNDNIIEANMLDELFEIAKIGQNRRPITTYGINFFERQYSWGRCLSNKPQNIRDFSLAVINDHQLTDSQVIALLLSRKKLSASCGRKKELESYISDRSESLDNHYSQYLLAAANFYIKNYQKAKTQFQPLANSDSAWIAEASQYLVARIQLLQSWNVRYDRNKPNNELRKKYALLSIDYFNQYISKYPNGQYTTSAKGLIRRGYWVAGMGEEYYKALSIANIGNFNKLSNTSKLDSDDISRLYSYFNEFNFYDYARNRDDSLYQVKRFIKDFDSLHKEKKVGPLERLNKFISMEESYKKGDLDKVISTYKNKNNLLDPEEVLMARAFEKNNQMDELIAYWKLRHQNFQKKSPNSFFSPSFDYELARLLIGSAGMKTFMKDESYQNLKIKRVYLASLCDESLQLDILNEKLDDNNKHIVLVDVALRYLFQQKFKKLNDLFSKHSDNVLKEYSAIRTAVKQIAENQSLGKAYMNLGYFMKEKIITPIYDINQSLKQNAPKNCQFNTVKLAKKTPYFYFNKSLEYFDNKKSSSEEKALYYLTMCSKRGSESNLCRWQLLANKGITSKEAFTKLHKKYRGGKWAKKAPYYY